MEGCLKTLLVGALLLLGVVLWALYGKEMAGFLLIPLAVAAVAAWAFIDWFFEVMRR